MDVKEEVYPTELDPHAVIEICERFPDAVIDRVSSRIVRIVILILENSIFLDDTNSFRKTHHNLHIYQIIG